MDFNISTPASWNGIVQALIRLLVVTVNSLLQLRTLGSQGELNLVNYGEFMHGLMKENIQLNRKVLSEIAMHEPYSFKSLVDIAKTAFPGNKVQNSISTKETTSMGK
ncbi:hypothetical protein KI387_023585 [Taxus chinensis]|uniref:Large ribosomal subunit protein bL20c n=1 Tax=Taxus chinensis TaxID=29808 RepID=A0AA38L7M0_TAXCH|nr:hypothetical protein KI387_023585 [Taxus chinensis]